MTRVTVATSLYEAARPYLGAWMAGVARALPPGADLRLAVAAHGFAAPAAALAPLVPAERIALRTLPASASIAAVRNAMLDAAAAAPADLVVFCDADDALLPGAVAAHAAALAGADFSYGDLALVDAAGAGQGATFFATGDVPPTLAGDALAARNFVGFSNAALRPAALARRRTAPDALAAVDWFLFSALLAAGATGRRVDAANGRPRAVAEYRQHGGNLLGAGRTADLAAARRRAAMADALFAARDAVGDRPRRAALARLRADDALFARALAATPAGPLLWFEDVAAWIAVADRHASEAA
jgi:glycosyltransferase involved in cell wall biosynthesis